MRRWVAAAFLVLGLGCAGFGAAPEPPPPGDGPAAVVAHTGDATADGPTADTAGSGEEDPAGPDPDAPRRPPARHKAKRKAHVRPPLTGPARPPPSVVAPKKKKTAPQPGPKPEGIEQVADRSWRVSRALVDRWQDDPYRLGNAREKDQGWELLGVKVKDAWHLGMRNKDLVLLVNGHKLHTKPQLLSAYLACKNDSEFEVTFVRAGETIVHHYTVVE